MILHFQRLLDCYTFRRRTTNIKIICFFNNRLSKNTLIRHAANLFKNFRYSTFRKYMLFLNLYFSGMLFLQNVDPWNLYLGCQAPVLFLKLLLLLFIDFLSCIWKIKNILRQIFFQFQSSINLPWNHVRSLKTLGPIGSAVLTLISSFEQLEWKFYLLIVFKNAV